MVCAYSVGRLVDATQDYVFDGRGSMPVRRRGRPEPLPQIGRVPVRKLAHAFAVRGANGIDDISLRGAPTSMKSDHVAMSPVFIVAPSGRRRRGGSPRR